MALTGLNYDRNFPTIENAPGEYVVTDRNSGSVFVAGPAPTPAMLPPSFGFGDPARGIWNVVPDEAPVQRGDILRFTYKLKIPFLENWQAGAVLSKLQKDDRWKIRYFALNEEIDRLVVECEITGVFKNNPAPVVAALVAGAVLAVAVGVGVWLATVSVEKLGTLDFSELAEGKLQILPALIAGVLLFFILGALTKYKHATA